MIFVASNLLRSTKMNQTSSQPTFLVVTSDRLKQQKLIVELRRFFPGCRVTNDPCPERRLTLIQEMLECLRSFS